MFFVRFDLWAHDSFVVGRKVDTVHKSGMYGGINHEKRYGA